MQKTPILTKNAPTPIGPYNQAITVFGKLVFTAGQIPIDPANGALIQGDIKAQTRQALKNVAAILEAAGTSLEHVVKTTVFLKDMNEFSAMNDVYGEFFKTTPPARSTVEVARLPRDVKIEIEAIAEVS